MNTRDTDGAETAAATDKNATTIEDAITHSEVCGAPVETAPERRLDQAAEFVANLNWFGSYQGNDYGMFNRDWGAVITDNGERFLVWENDVFDEDFFYAGDVVDDLREWLPGAGFREVGYGECSGGCYAWCMIIEPARSLADQERLWFDSDAVLEDARTINEWLDKRHAESGWKAENGGINSGRYTNAPREAHAKKSGRQAVDFTNIVPLEEAPRDLAALLTFTAFKLRLIVQRMGLLDTEDEKLKWHGLSSDQARAVFVLEALRNGDRLAAKAARVAKSNGDGTTT